jgi:hypothetical protein
MVFYSSSSAFFIVYVCGTLWTCATPLSHEEILYILCSYLFCHTRIWIHGLELVKQAPYFMTHNPSPVFSFFTESSHISANRILAYCFRPKFKVVKNIPSELGQVNLSSSLKSALYKHIIWSLSHSFENVIVTNSSLLIDKRRG